MAAVQLSALEQASDLFARLDHNELYELLLRGYEEAAHRADEYAHACCGTDPGDDAISDDVLNEASVFVERIHSLFNYWVGVARADACRSLIHQAQEDLAELSANRMAPSV